MHLEYKFRSDGDDSENVEVAVESACVSVPQPLLPARSMQLEGAPRAQHPAAHLPTVWQEDAEYSTDTYFTRACGQLRKLCREKVRLSSGLVRACCL
jgi:hypothetical protein